MGPSGCRDGTAVTESAALGYRGAASVRMGYRGAASVGMEDRSAASVMEKGDGAQ